MVAFSDLTQVMQNARTDAKTLDEYVHGAADTQVTSRLNKRYWTLATLDNKLSLVKIKAETTLADIDTLAKSTNDALTAKVANANTAIDSKVAAIDARADAEISNLQDAINAAAAAGAGANGWDDMLIAVSENVNQRQINDGLESIAQLLAIKNPRSGQRVYVKSYHAELGKGGGIFIYDSTKSSINDGGYIINGWVRQILNNVVTPMMFGAKADSITDDTDAFNNAIQIFNSLFVPNGGYVIKGDVNFKSVTKLIGQGCRSTEINLGDTGRFVARGTGVIDDTQLFREIEVRDITFTSDNEARESVLFDWTGHSSFTRCFFLRTGFWLNRTILRVDFKDCYLWDCKVQSLHSDGNDLTAAPKFYSSFIQNTNILCTNSIDLLLSDSFLFGGSVISEIKQISEDANTFGTPVFISNCVFDTTKDVALRLTNHAFVKIVNTFFSGGRTANVDGVQLKNCYSVSVTNSTLHFCGNNGMQIWGCVNTKITSTYFGANKKAGLSISGVENKNVIITSCEFARGDSPVIGGGNYLQTTGVTDASGTTKGIRVISCIFDDTLPVKAFIPDSTSRALLNIGLEDKIS